MYACCFHFSKIPCKTCKDEILPAGMAQAYWKWGFNYIDSFIVYVVKLFVTISGAGALLFVCFIISLFTVLIGYVFLLFSPFIQHWKTKITILIPFSFHVTLENKNVYFYFFFLFIQH